MTNQIETLANILDTHTAPGTVSHAGSMLRGGRIENHASHVEAYRAWLYETAIELDHLQHPLETCDYGY